MDTAIDHTIVAVDKSTAREAMLIAQAEFERIDSLLWEENPGSEIYRYNQSRTGIETTEEVFSFVQRAVEYYRTEVELDLEKTEGTFNIAIGPVVQLYDFHADNPVPPAAAEINQALPDVKIGNIILKEDPSTETYFLGKKTPETRIAVGGIAKGYAVDSAIRLLRRRGFNEVLINAGGDLYCSDGNQGKPWKVGIQHPVELSEILKILELKNAAIATSGDYQRYYIYHGQRYHHLLDARTGKPARLSRSASVIAPSAEEADVWATSLFVLGAEAGIEMIDNLDEVHGMVIDSAGTVHYSRDFESFLAD
jgi:thiamine biosynthesis lipoprotein